MLAILWPILAGGIAFWLAHRLKGGDDFCDGDIRALQRFFIALMIISFIVGIYTGCGWFWYPITVDLLAWWIYATELARRGLICHLTLSDLAGMFILILFLPVILLLSFVSFDKSFDFQRGS